MQFQNENAIFKFIRLIPTRTRALSKRSMTFLTKASALFY